MARNTAKKFCQKVLVKLIIRDRIATSLGRSVATNLAILEKYNYENIYDCIAPPQDGIIVLCIETI